jgi:DUF971 family protein
MSVPELLEIKLLQKSRVLELTFASAEHFSLTCEYLRVFSPSAEVRGHGKPKPVFGKQDVNIIGIEPVGHYAVKLIFDDGHASGIYSWETLYELAKNHEGNWRQYKSQPAP